MILHASNQLSELMKQKKIRVTVFFELYDVLIWMLLKKQTNNQMLTQTITKKEERKSKLHSKFDHSSRHLNVESEAIAWW